jgi:hypothetical protein
VFGFCVIVESVAEMGLFGCVSEDDSRVDRLGLKVVGFDPPRAIDEAIP